MSVQSSTSEKVGQAWNHYREGRADAAAKEFEAILRQNPEDIDASYGLGLAQKATGQLELASKTFETTLEFVNTAKLEYESTRQVQLEENNVKTPEDDRFMMLDRMVRQRLAEVQVVKAD